MRKRWTIAGIVLFIALNLWILFRIAGKDSARPRGVSHDREARATALRTEWSLSRAVPLTPAQIRDAVTEIRSGECFSLPPGSNPVSRTELTEQQLADLQAAIAGIVDAYAQSSPRDLISYMAERQMRLEPSLVARHRLYLIEALGRSHADVDEMPDEDVYSAMWRSLGGHSHWEGLVVESSCWQTWTSASMTAAQIKDSEKLVNDLFAIFQGVRSWTNHFVPDGHRSLEAELLADGSVLVADVSLIIEHDAEFFHEKAPYLYRFWYNRSSDTWQPLLMVRIKAFEGAPTEIMF